MDKSFKTTLSAITALFLASSLVAQESNTLEKMIVTAEKKEADIQKVPISMSVFDETKLEDSKINDITEMTYYTPNLYSQQSINNKTLILRGISSHAVALNTPVGLFVDDINYPMTFMQNPDLMDVERIEILRGPQGTLYGRNTEAGAIKIITKKPDNEFRGKLFLETGIYDTPQSNPSFVKAGVALSGPIKEDNLYMGLSLQTRDSDGFMKNKLNNNEKAGKIDHKTGQATVRWTPTDKTEASLLFNRFENNDGYAYTRYLDGAAQSERYTVNWDGANRWIDKNSGQALKVEHNEEDFKFVSITTNNDFKTHFDNDGEFGSFTTPDQIWEFENETLSQELRLSSPDNTDNLEWLLGLYAFKDKNYAKAEFFGQTRYTDFKNKGYALFTQGTYTFNEKLHLTTGLRYDYQKAEGEQKSNLTANSYSKDFDSKELLPKISLAYDFNEDTMGYASVSKGLLAGGYNYAFAGDSSNLTFDAESTWNYELGIKTSLLDNKVTLNGAVFHIDIKDKQVVDAISPTVRMVTNAAKAYSRGVELDLNAQVDSNLNLFAGFGVIDAKIKNWTSRGIDFKDKKLTHAPKYTYNLGAKYSFDSGYYSKADILGIGDFYNDAQNDTKIDGYHLVNLGFGYQGEDFDISLWGKNIFDKEYYLSKGVYWANSTTVQDGAPRTFGITLNYYF